MYVNNPYALWGSSATPSIFGALPAATLSTKTSFVSFHFTSFNPTILNCDVVGPDCRLYFKVVTDSSMPNCSLFQREDQTIAFVEWQDRPKVEIRNKLSKRAVHQWLNLSPDRSYRYMQVNGQQYIWAPNQNFICMYTSGSSPSEMLARISRGQGTVTLDIAASAVHAGLLEASIVATVLLQCNRNID